MRAAASRWMRAVLRVERAVGRAARRGRRTAARRAAVLMVATRASRLARDDRARRAREGRAHALPPVAPRRPAARREGGPPAAHGGGTVGRAARARARPGGRVVSSPESAGCRALLRETERTAIRARNGLKYLGRRRVGARAPDAVRRRLDPGAGRAAPLPRATTSAIASRSCCSSGSSAAATSSTCTARRASCAAPARRRAGRLRARLGRAGTGRRAEHARDLRRSASCRARCGPPWTRPGAERASMVGYCMGGNLALHGAGSPGAAGAATSSPWRRRSTSSQLPGLAGAIREREIDPDTLVDWTGNVPPQYLSAFFRARKPTADIPNLARLWEEALGRRVRRGAPGDGALGARARPVPGAAFRQVADQWLRAQRLHDRAGSGWAGAGSTSRRVTLPDAEHPRDARRPRAAGGRRPIGERHRRARSSSCSSSRPGTPA